MVSFFQILHQGANHAIIMKISYLGIPDYDILWQPAHCLTHSDQGPHLMSAVNSNPQCVLQWMLCAEAIELSLVRFGDLAGLVEHIP